MAVDCKIIIGEKSLSKDTIRGIPRTHISPIATIDIRGLYPSSKFSKLALDRDDSYLLRERGYFYCQTGRERVFEDACAREFRLFDVKEVLNALVKDARDGRCNRRHFLAIRILEKISHDFQNDDVMVILMAE